MGTSPGRASCAMLVWTLHCKRQERVFFEGFWRLEGRGEEKPDLTVPGLSSSRTLPSSVRSSPTTGGQHSKEHGPWQPRVTSFQVLPPNSRLFPLRRKLVEKIPGKGSDWLCLGHVPIYGPITTVKSIGHWDRLCVVMCAPLVVTLLPDGSRTKRCWAGNGNKYGSSPLFADFVFANSLTQ